MDGWGEERYQPRCQQGIKSPGYTHREPQGSPISPSSDNGQSSPEQPSPNMHTLSSSPTSENVPNLSLAGVGNSEHHPRISLLTHHTGGANADMSNPVQPDPFNMVRFGANGKFLDQGGWPRLSFVVDASPSLFEILNACDNAAKTIFEDCGSSSEWKPILGRNYYYINNPTVRLHIPTVVNDNIALYAVEIHQKDSSGTVQKLVFSKFDAAELGNLTRGGIFVDAFFSLDTYGYQKNASIRLVVKKLVIHSD
ncbi:hypothetical protein PVK06_045038 [Gossypium arboreum]|uniref:Uncharacterized protein n=1 Tax=Gossypium arboreum TaxID=29729 RepID=A0ABR0MSX0_GOSAR|nr:hypothetical protein PVK06_045038 [Gossypium arboreum]